MADYSDIFLEAVQTIVDGTVSKLQFDKTIVCNIINTKNAEKGEYYVSDGATTYIAYSENTTYEEGQSVYVNIPNGDYSKQKVITGKYTGDTGNYYTYSSPWKKFVDITGNLVSEEIKENSVGILANRQVIKNISEEQYDEIEIWSSYIEDGLDYTCIGLQAGFRAFLSALGAASGKYGLRLYIRTVDKNSSSSVKIYKTHKVDLTIEDFNGDPYGFESYYTQQKVFDISGLGQIHSISLILFQKNDFYTPLGKLIPHLDGEGNLLPNNIFVKNIYLALGYSLDSFNGDVAMLYTTDPKTYNGDYGRGDKNIKTLKVRWIHEEEETGNIVAYTDSRILREKAIVHWYKYKLDQNVMDDIAGMFWEEIPEYKNTFEQKIDFFNYIEYQDVKIKVIIETPIKENLLKQSIFDDDVIKAKLELDNAKVELDEALVAYNVDNNEITTINYESALEKYEEKNEQYEKAIEKYSAEIQYIESPVLTFENEQQVPDLATLDLIQALSLDVDPDGYKGIYNLYDQTNYIQNTRESNILRTITANYFSTLTGETDLDSAESITWLIPLTNTMIETPEDGKEFDSSVDEISESEDGSYLMIRRDGELHTGSIGSSFKNAAQQNFRIKKYFTETATNNIIYCYVVKNKKTYEASFAMTFGPMGTNGTDFTFTLQMESDRTCFFGCEPDPAADVIRIDAKLYDYNNFEVPNAQDCDITYSWYSKDDLDLIGFCTEDGILLDSDGYELNYDLTNPELVLNKNTFLMTHQTLKANGPGEAESHTHCYIRRLRPIEIACLNGYNKTQIDSIENNGGLIPYYYIVEASIEIDATSETKAFKNKIILNSYLPIAYSADYDITQLEGTTKIIYNSSGVAPYYYKEPYKLYSYNTQLTNILWDEKNGAKSLTEERFYPDIDNDGNIKPPSSYVSELSSQVATVAYEKTYNESLQTYEKGRVLWTQPILISQNPYGSAMLNAWDGNLNIDEEKGTIMSTMMGAGYKDRYNRFNGILIGDVKSTVDKGADTGIFGYGEGVQSFGFKTDGTAFLGKSGKGQIQFDGNSSSIQSMSYANKQTGMKIDLDDGFIEMRGNEIQSVQKQSDTTSIDLLSIRELKSTEVGTKVYLLKNGNKITAGQGISSLKSLIELLQRKENGQYVIDIEKNNISATNKQNINKYLQDIKNAGDYIIFSSNAIDSKQNVIQYFNQLLNSYTNTQDNLKNVAKTNRTLASSLEKNSSSSGALEKASKLIQEAEILEKEASDYDSKIKEVNDFIFLANAYEEYQKYNLINEAYNNFLEDEENYESQYSELAANLSHLALNTGFSSSSRILDYSNNILTAIQDRVNLQNQLLDLKKQLYEIENKPELISRGEELKREIALIQTQIDSLSAQKEEYEKDALKTVLEELEVKTNDKEKLILEAEKILENKQNLIDDQKNLEDLGDLNENKREELKNRIVELEELLNSESDYMKEFFRLRDNYFNQYAYVYNGISFNNNPSNPSNSNSSVTIDGVTYRLKKSITINDDNKYEAYSRKKLYEEIVLKTIPRDRFNKINKEIQNIFSNSTLQTIQNYLDKIEQDLEKLFIFYNYDENKNYPTLFLKLTYSPLENFLDNGTDSLSYSNFDSYFNTTAINYNTSLNKYSLETLCSLYLKLYNILYSKEEEVLNSKINDINTIYHNYDNFMYEVESEYNSIKQKLQQYESNPNSVNYKNAYLLFYGHDLSEETKTYSTITIDNIEEKVSFTNSFYNNIKGLTNTYENYLLTTYTTNHNNLIKSYQDTMEDNKDLLNCFQYDRDKIQNKNYVRGAGNSFYADTSQWIKNYQNTVTEQTLDDFLNKHLTSIINQVNKTLKYSYRDNKVTDEQMLLVLNGIINYLENEEFRLTDLIHEEEIAYNTTLLNFKSKLDFETQVLEDYKTQYEEYKLNIEQLEKDLEEYRQELRKCEIDCFYILLNPYVNKIDSNYLKFVSIKNDKDQIKENNNEYIQKNIEISNLTIQINQIKNTSLDEESNKIIEDKFTTPIRNLTTEKNTLQNQLNNIYKSQLTSKEFNIYNTANSQISNLSSNIKSKFTTIKTNFTNIINFSVTLNNDSSDLDIAKKDFNTERTQVNSKISSLNSERIKRIQTLKNLQSKYSSLNEDRLLSDIQADLNTWKSSYTSNIGIIEKLNLGIYSSTIQNEYEEYLKNTSISSNIPVNLINNSELSPQYTTSRSGVKISTTSPYFTLKNSNGKNLFCIADNDYYMQSADYDKTLKQGVNFDLLHGNINGYNFSLKSFLNETGNQYNGSFIYLSSKGTTASPYFRIHHKNQNDVKNIDLDLIHISQKDFYLQSHNWENGKNGLRFDMAKGNFQAFNNFKLKAVNYNGTTKQGMIVFSSSGDPYFQIQSLSSQKNTSNKTIGLVDLIRIEKNKFVLNSLNWAGTESSTVQGLHIDLAAGQIISKGNFKLMASVADATDSNIKNKVIISSGNNDDPLISVERDGIKLLRIDSSQYLLQSYKWSDTSETGTQINLNKGSITSYNFTLKAKKSGTSKQILINSNATTYPFEVLNGTAYTKISWDGTLYTQNIKATVSGQIGPFHFNSNAMYTGDASLGGSGVYLGMSGISVANGRFIVDQDGYLSAGPKNNRYLIVNGTQVVINTADTLIKGKTTISGNTTINDELHVNDKLYVAAESTFSKKIDVSGSSTFTGSVTIEGSLTVTGQITGANWTVGAGSAGLGDHPGQGSALTANNLEARGGHIGKWKIGNTLSSDNDKIILNPSEENVTSAITIHGNTIGTSNVDGNIRLELHGKNGVYLKTGESAYLLVQNSKISLWTPVTSSSSTVDITTYKFKVDGIFEMGKKGNTSIINGPLDIRSKTGSSDNVLEVTSDGKVKINGKNLGALAFKDSLKKKFDVTLTDTSISNVYYKNGTKTISKTIYYKVSDRCSHSGRLEYYPSSGGGPYYYSWWDVPGGRIYPSSSHTFSYSIDWSDSYYYGYTGHTVSLTVDDYDKVTSVSINGNKEITLEGSDSDDTIIESNWNSVDTTFRYE